MPKYRVTLRRNSVEVVTADNPFQAANVAADLFGEGVEIADVRSAVGRPTSTVRKMTAKKSVKKVAKNRRPVSPQARARLAQNLVKARAARARYLKAAKKSTKASTKKTAARKSVKKVVRSR